MQDAVREVRVKTETGKVLRILSNDLDAPAPRSPTLQAPLGDRAVLPLGQADPEDHPLPRHPRKCRANPDRRRADRLSAAAPGAGRPESRHQPAAFARLVRANLMHRRPLDRLLKPEPPTLETLPNWRSNGTSAKPDSRGLSPVILRMGQLSSPCRFKRIFARIDAAIFRMLWQWACARHARGADGSVKSKYFERVGTRDWWFFGESPDEGPRFAHLRLFHAASVRIVRHVSVKSEVNPYDPGWASYLDQRLQMRASSAGLFTKPYGPCVVGFTITGMRVYGSRRTIRCGVVVDCDRVKATHSPSGRFPILPQTRERHDAAIGERESHRCCLPCPSFPPLLAVPFLQ